MPHHRRDAVYAVTDVSGSGASYSRMRAVLLALAIALGITVASVLSILLHVS